MGVHEITVATRNELARRGWVQNDWISSDGRVCMFGAYLCSANLEVNYETTKCVSLTDPGARTLARALGFRSPKELMLWNDAQGRTISEVLERLDFAIRKTAPLPVDPLVGVEGYALTPSELPARRGVWARAWITTMARVRSRWARGRTVRSRELPHIRRQVGARSPVTNAEPALEAVGVGAAPSAG